jgi:hypothetical protein
MATTAAEKRRAFTMAALKARQQFARTGVAYAMEDVHAYLKTRAAGKKVRRPKPRHCRLWYRMDCSDPAVPE